MPSYLAGQVAGGSMTPDSVSCASARAKQYNPLLQKPIDAFAKVQFGHQR